MSESDSFIKEVTEEVRQDRMFHLWKRYGPYVIGGIIVVVGAAAIWNWLQHQRVVEARETGAAFIAAEIDDVAAQEALLAEVEGSRAVVAQLRVAAAKADEGDTAGAIAGFREAAAMDAAALPYRQFAVLSAVALDAATGDPAMLINELAPLVEEGAPFRPMALELRGAIRLNAGEIAAAREDFDLAMQAPQATVETRRRVGEMIASMGPVPE